MLFPLETVSKSYRFQSFSCRCKVKTQRKVCGFDENYMETYSCRRDLSMPKINKNCKNLMTSSIYTIYCKKEKVAEILVRSKCPNYSFGEVPKQHFQIEKSISVKNPDAHFALKFLTNQDLEPMLCKFSLGFTVILYHSKVAVGSFHFTFLQISFFQYSMHLI